MEKSRQLPYQIFITFLLILATGTVGYYVIEDNWTVFDSFYMTIITITTVGFSETHDLSIGGRIFTIILILVGFSAAATFATSMAKLIIENQISGVFRRRTMQKRIQKLKKHYVICGFGRIGSTIAFKLHEKNIPFVLIDSNTDAISTAEQRGYLFIDGNATNDATLTSANIEQAAGITICTSNDADNLFIALAARELNHSIYIIVQGDDPRIEDRLRRAGANRVVYPLKLGGEQIANIITEKISGGNDKKNISFDNPNSFYGYSIKKYIHFCKEEITVNKIIKRTGATRVVAIEQTDGNIDNNPNLSSLVYRNDNVLLLLQEDRSKFTKIPDKLTWTENLSVGIPSLDEEHKKLIHITNELIYSLMEGSDSRTLDRMFNELLDFTGSHFSTEEELFDFYGYPDKDIHLAEHNILSKQITNIHRQRDILFLANIIDILKIGLLDHITNVDKNYSNFLSSRGVT